jgi:formate dehydrogenase major subunit
VDFPLVCSPASIDNHGRRGAGYRRFSTTRSQPVKRRTFLKGSAAAVGGAVALGFDLKQARAEMRELKIARTTETRSTCPYCSVSCGVIIHTLGDKSKNVKPAVVHVEGDPDHPINRGTLCPKGITLREDIVSSNRLTTPKVRRPGSDKWENISWDQAIGEISKEIKATRDRTFVAKNAKGEVVNRTPGMAMIGGCTDTNEMNFLMLKAIAGLGIAYRDTQARV